MVMRFGSWEIRRFYVMQFHSKQKQVS